MSDVPVIFEGLDEADMKELNELLCTHNDCSEGDVVVTEGDPTRDCFILSTGSLRVEKKDEAGNTQVLAHLSAPTVLGELGMITGEPRTATVVAIGSAKVVTVSGDKFLGLIKSGSLAAHRMSFNVLKILARRQQSMNRESLRLMQRVASAERRTDDVTQLREKLLKEWSF